MISTYTGNMTGKHYIHTASEARAVWNTHCRFEAWIMTQKTQGSSLTERTNHCSIALSIYYSLILLNRLLNNLEKPLEEADNERGT
jgi:hypothetical protein